ncbi:hypothetical protein N7468_003217 [Penicillium chermesinum]|uniref:Secreted protein n=1 Tax=Penicillium chermesinum TaxID=63820 RepID=A0A9W9TS16_9EURO|nr:uncharacterized protein N7468_003217 [Penicillium chermesinum]KAJ5238598.1 hypothetical protein N7468_003217 [Penicillium chermesinum]KAJ6164251.1 hypothetical protein N7470_002923 [Penicillium chermesinum]
MLWSSHTVGLVTHLLALVLHLLVAAESVQTWQPALITVDTAAQCAFRRLAAKAVSMESASAARQLHPSALQQEFAAQLEHRALRVGHFLVVAWPLTLAPPASNPSGADICCPTACGTANVCAGF